jgi:DNA-binding CsgD family transcriptional regulator
MLPRKIALSHRITEVGRYPRSFDRQPLTANDLQQVLDCTGVPKIVLDDDLKIRFFTPATTLLFDIVAGDIGRTLTDLTSRTFDCDLLRDAGNVLQTLVPMEREIETRSGAWYVRRILPYHADGTGFEGLVLTFTNVTHQREAAAALRQATVRADSASVAKSRFLAAVNHDLRQPLQTLVLLQELLAKVVVGEKASTLVGRIDRTLGAMSETLNAMLDVNQIEVATVRAEVEPFRIDAAMETRQVAAERLAHLTRRQHQIMELVLAGQPSKIIAADLGISQRTVENHRASIMKKAGVKSLPALARLSLAAAGTLTTGLSPATSFPAVVL